LQFGHADLDLAGPAVVKHEEKDTGAIVLPRGDEGVANGGVQLRDQGGENDEREDATQA